MTLIAALKPDGHPVLLGDLLISGERPEHGDPPDFGPVFLPSVGLTLPPDPNASHQIVATRQKLCIITDNLAVGWSGDYPVAERIVRAMLDHFSPGPLNLADIEVFLTTCNYDDLYRSDLHLVGACFDDRMFYTFGFSASKWDLPLFGKSYIAGSGLRTFLDLFGRYDPHDLPVPPNPFSVALAKSLFVAGTLVGSEIYSTQALTVHFFGGFYELMLRLQSGFTKMGDVLYTFWLFNPLPDTADEFRLRLLLLVKIDYEHDILVSRRIELHYHQDGPPSKKDAVHFVSPIYRDVTEEELKGMRPPTVNATHFCHLIFVQIDNEWNFLVIPEVSPIKKSIVIEEEGDGTQRLQFSSAFINRVAQDIIASKRRNDQRHTR